jgi:hypothetical protein
LPFLFVPLLADGYEDWCEKSKILKLMGSYQKKSEAYFRLLHGGVRVARSLEWIR